MPLKVYETIGILNRYITAIIDGLEVTIQFKNGVESPRIIQGQYSTKDKKVQEWLESRVEFGTKWRLIKTVTLPEEMSSNTTPVTSSVDPHDDLAQIPPREPAYTAESDDDKGTIKPTPMSVQEDVDEDFPLEIEENITTNNNPHTFTVVESVTNGQQARNYMIEHYKGELTLRKLANNDMIIAAARERNIQFINWDAFINAQ